MIVDSFFKRMCLLTALFYLIATATPAAMAQSSGNDQQRIGTATAVEGVIYLTRNGISKKIEAGAPIFQQDIIRSKADSRARLLFNDRSIVSVGPDTVLTINEFVYNPTSKVRTSKFRLLLGKIKCFVNDVLGFKNKKFEVSTQTAVIGVRGTDFLVWAVSVDLTRIAGFSNYIDVANIEAVGEPIVVGPNFWTEVLAGQGPTEAVQVTPALFNLLHQGMFPIDAAAGAGAGAGGAGAGAATVAGAPVTVAQLAGLGPMIPGLALVGAVTLYRRYHDPAFFLGIGSGRRIPRVTYRHGTYLRVIRL